MDFNNKAISYKELANLSDLIVEELPKASLFGIYFKASLNCVAVYLGALRNGHTVLLINPNVNEEIQKKILKKFAINIIYKNDLFHDIGINISKNIKINSEARILMSTSGSTGSPKLVKLSATNLRSNASSIAKYLKLSKDDRAISSLPLHQAYGLSVLNSHLEAGAKILLTELSITNKKFWTMFKSQKISSLAGVPTVWRILRNLYFERMDLPNLKYITQAGGKLDISEIKWLSKLSEVKNLKLYIMYGMTEATARISYYEPLLNPSKIGSVGKPIPGGKLSIYDEKKEKVKIPFIEGELVYEGKNVMLGYAEEICDFKKDIISSQLKTGDLGYFDDEEYYWLTGRIKRFIKLTGYRFNLDDIETFLRDNEIESAVIGEDDLLVIVVIDENIKKNDLINFISGKFNINFKLIKVLVIKKFPKSSVGKILYGKLKETLID